jgi:hypothetical protein
VSIGVKIFLTGAIAADSIREGSDILSITRVSATAIIGRTSLNTIAVDVHVGEFTTGALEVDNAIVGKMVTTVRGTFVKGNISQTAQFNSSGFGENQDLLPPSLSSL